MSPTWTCAGCGMTIRYAPGSSVPAGLPRGWSSDGDDLHCLGCRRQAVSETAATAHAEAPEAERRRAVRAALARFELERNPDRSDGTIGRLIGVASGTVGEVRRELLAGGDISRRERSEGSKNPGAGRRAEEELRRDPNRSNAEIGRVLDVGPNTVARARKRMNVRAAVSDSVRLDTPNAPNTARQP